MGLTISYLEGNGSTDDQLSLTISLPDAGSSIYVEGYVQLAPIPNPPINGQSQPPTVQPRQTIAQTVTAPPAPASGSTFYNVQVDGATGVVSVLSSPTASPAPANTTSRVIFSQVLIPSTVDLATDADVTPDPALGAA